MRPHESPELNPDHLYHATDSTGIFQHANFTAPNPSEGHWTGDNARARILDSFVHSMPGRSRPQ